MGKREHMSSKNADALPVVDLAPFLVAAGGDGGVSRATEAVRAACWEYGFFRVVNHGVPPELTARVLELSAVFFALPDEEKAKLGFNLYPDEPTGFREALDECFGKLTQLGVLIQEILNESMGLPPGFLKEYNGDRSFDFMASLRYSPATAEENNGISEHEDSNCITFVLQDGAGGLEVLKDGVWVPADPVEGSIIVNLGDVIQVLTNGKMKSATHRVVRKPAVHRHSLAFFFNVHGDRWVEPLPEYTEKIGEAPRYRRFLYSEYQQLRMRNKTHPPARPEDVVNITHYAI
uniref:Fe2OG dioxygenase domain-containing protein n=1 Tax=Oryza brachyantha TaxID=4533 RepID=J3M1X6_ORYBR